MAKSILYGIFDANQDVQQKLKQALTTGTETGNTLYSGYTECSVDKRRLICYTKLYNTEDLALFTGETVASPAKILMSLYEKEGIKGFKRLNGKFTIILREAENTTIVRDRHGEGPMIFYTNGFFTDSYHNLWNFSAFQPEPDLTGLTTFLKLGYIPAPVTSLKGVQKIPAGNVLYYSNGNFRLEELFPFSDILSTQRIQISKEEAMEQFHVLLKQSLSRRTKGIEPVGCLLSGGFDSGGNLAFTREIFPGKIKTFSIGFKDNPASELPFAKMVAGKFGAEYHEYIMDGTEIEFVPEIIDILGDPFAESGFMLNHSAMRMISREEPPVVLGGDGNDQYFGAGIRETALHYFMRRAGLAPFAKFFNLISDNSLFDHDNLAFRIHFQNQKILRVMEPETFGFHDYQLNQIFRMNEVAPHPYRSVLPWKFSDYKELWLQRNYFLHLHHSVDEVILFKASRFSEHFGVNLTFSYMDLDLFHFIQSLPLNLRAKGDLRETMKGKGVSKYIQKELLRSYLPQQVTKRGKQGGFSPLEIFFNTAERRQKIYRYIQGSELARSLKQNNFLVDFCNKYEALMTSKPYWFWYKQVKSGQMLNMLILAIWWDKIFGGKKSGKLSEYIG